MANEKISDLPDGAPAQPADEIPIARGGTNFRLAASAIAALATGGTGTGGIAAGIAGNVAGAPQTVSTGTLVIAGGNNITLSQIGNNVTISGGASGGVDITMGGNTAGVAGLISSGTLFLAGGNNVTLSQVGNSISISAGTAAAANLSISAGASSGAFGGMTFQNAGGVSFGLNNGTITASIGAQSVQTQASGGIVGSGFTTGGIAGSVIQATANSAGILMGVPPFLTTQSVQTQASGNIARTGVTTTTQAGSTMGVTNNTLGLSLAVPQWITGGGGGGVDVTLGGNTSGAVALISTGTMFLAGGANVTLSQNANSITISAATAAGLTTGGAFIGGNTTGASTSGTYQLTGLNVSAGGILSAGWSAGTLILSAPASTGISQSLFATGNTTQGSSGTQALGSILFSGAGNVSVGVTGNTVVISATGGGGGGGGGVNFGVSTGGNTAGATGTVSTGNVVLVGSGPISLSQATGGAGSNATITINAPGTSSLSGTGQLSISRNGGTISLGVPTLSAFLAGNTTLTSSGTFANGNMVLSGAGNVTLGYSLGTVIVSATGGGGGAGLDVTLGGNTSGALALVSTGTLFLAGGPNITLSQNGNSVSISGGIGGGQSVQTQASGNIAGTGVTTTTQAGSTIGVTQNTAGLSLAIPPWVTVGGGGGNFSAGVSGGNTAGVSGTVSNAFVLAGGNNITLSGSTNAGGMSVTVSAASQTGASFSMFVVGNTTQQSSSIRVGLISINAIGNISAGVSGGSIVLSAATGQNYFAAGNTTQNSSSVLAVSAQTLNGLGALSVGFSGGSVLLSAPATSSISGTGGLSASVNGSTIFLGQGAISRSIWPAGQLEAISAPGQGSVSVQYFPADGALSASRLDALVGWSANSAATNATMAIAMSVWGAIYTKNGSTLSSISSGSTQTTYSYASNTAGNTQLTASAIRAVSVPIAMSFTQGEYYVGFNFSTAASSVGATTTNYGQTLSMYGGSQIQSALNYADFTQATATSIGLYGGMGVFTAATAGMPASIGLAALNQGGQSQSQANIGLVFRNV